MAYEESVRSPRWFIGLMLLFALVALLAGTWLLRDEQSRSDGGTIAGLTLFSVGLLLALLARVFGTLRIRVSEGALRVRFGPWGPTLRGEEIAEARVEPYRWLAYGGWGIRIGRQGGRMSRAYSAPFVRSGVVVDMQGGRRYHVTSRRPAELARAVNELTTEDSTTRADQ